MLFFEDYLILLFVFDDSLQYFENKDLSIPQWGVLTNVPVDGGRSAISIPGMPILGGSKGKRGNNA